MRRLERWFRKFLLFLPLLLAGFFFLAPGIVEKRLNPVAEHADWPVGLEARALHKTLFIGDWHADSLLWNRDLLHRSDRGQVDLPRLIEGNVGLQVFTAVTKSPMGQNYEANATDSFDNITALAILQLWPTSTWSSLTARALYQARKLQGFAERSGGQLMIVRSRADLDALLELRADGETVVGGLLGLEGAHALDGQLSNLGRLWDAGYRLIGLQHFFDNELGGSLHGQGNVGLSDFGREVLAEAEARGMVIDVAHSSPQVIEDVLAIAQGPVILSHTGIRSRCNTKRNIPDDLMRRIAQTGGTIGIGYWKDVTCDDSPAGIAATIRAAVDLLGEDHVSLGSDFDGSVATAFDTSELAALTRALIDVGLSEDQIRKVMGQNMLRVLRARLPD